MPTRTNLDFAYEEIPEARKTVISRFGGTNNMSYNQTPLPEPLEIEANEPKSPPLAPIQYSGSKQELERQ